MPSRGADRRGAGDWADRVVGWQVPADPERWATREGFVPSPPGGPGVRWWTADRWPTVGRVLTPRVLFDNICMDVIE